MTILLQPIRCYQNLNLLAFNFFLAFVKIDRSIEKKKRFELAHVQQGFPVDGVTRPVMCDRSGIR